MAGKVSIASLPASKNFFRACVIHLTSFRSSGNKDTNPVLVYITLYTPFLYENPEILNIGLFHLELVELMLSSVSSSWLSIRSTDDDLFPPKYKKCYRTNVWLRSSLRAVLLILGRYMHIEMCPSLHLMHCFLIYLTFLSLSVIHNLFLFQKWQQLLPPRGNLKCRTEHIAVVTKINFRLLIVAAVFMSISPTLSWILLSNLL